MARAQPLWRLAKLLAAICLRPNKAPFNEVVLFIRGKQVSEYEHTRSVPSSRVRRSRRGISRAVRKAPTPWPELYISTSLRYAHLNLAGNDQQRQRRKGK